MTTSYDIGQQAANTGMPGENAEGYQTWTMATNLQMGLLDPLQKRVRFGQFKVSGDLP